MNGCKEIVREVRSAKLASSRKYSKACNFLSIYTFSLIFKRHHHVHETLILCAC
jgi:hypothetical protein